MPEIELIIDATEQERQKPKERGKRKRYYSGRKKKHTIKSQIVVKKRGGLILDVSSGWEGRVHDLKVFEGSGLVEKFRRFQVKEWTDKGYLGIEGIVKGWQIEKPKKKPKGRELTEEEKERHREINRERVEVEHGIMRIKRHQFFGEISW